LTGGLDLFLGTRYKAIMRHLATIITMLVTITISAQARAQSAEKFRYQVTWGDAEVATMKLDIGCPRGSHVPAALVAKSTGVANQIHSFDVRLDSFYQPGLRSLEGRTQISEEGEQRRFRSRFKTPKRVRVEKTFRGKVTQKAFALPGVSHDLLSWMLHLREKELKPGVTHKYWVWDGWKLSRIDAVVGKKEAVSTGQGVKNAFAINLFRTVFHHGGPKKFKQRRDRDELGTLWLGVDRAHTPWAMTFDAPIGMARVALKSMTRSTCK
jgi:hypothetical protein